MWGVVVFPITGSIKGFRFPDPINEWINQMPPKERDSAVRLSVEGQEGYLLFETRPRWSPVTVEGAETHGPFDTPQAARAFINERAKRWALAASGKKEVQ